jgi:hypothetical protein
MLQEVVVEFVECAVHQILCARKIYPECNERPDLMSLTTQSVDRSL